MHSFHQVKILPYKLQDLFSLVLDIGVYPEFLPWCRSIKVVSRDQYQIIADVAVQFKGFSEQYRCKITPIITENSHIIEVEAISGPFKFLKNIWQFANNLPSRPFYNEENQTKVEFYIEFEFKSIILEKLMGIFFDSIARQMISVFEQRAANVLS